MSPATSTVTVVLPVFNASNYLRQAVLSIVQQRFKDWTLLVIDDGSTDSGLDTIADIQDERITILRDGANKGLAARLNEAIDLSDSPYFARMDADDVAYPQRFEKQLALLESDPGLDVVATRAVTISCNNALTGELPYALSHSAICARPWLGFYLAHPTWLGRTAWFRKHRYAIPAPYFCEDQELLLRSHAESRFATVDQILFAYRVRNRINWKKQTKTRWALFNIQLRYFLNSGQFHFALLALAAFAGRVTSDLLRVTRQALVGERYLRTTVDSADSTRWQDVLKQTLGNS